MQTQIELLLIYMASIESLLFLVCLVFLKQENIEAESSMLTSQLLTPLIGMKDDD